MLDRGQHTARLVQLFAGIIYLFPYQLRLQAVTDVHMCKKQQERACQRQYGYQEYPCQLGG